MTSYQRPELLGEAIDLLAEHGEDAKVLAGGQSLVPMMTAGFVAPEVLVDINHLPDLDMVAALNGEVRIGALVRHRTLEHAGPELTRAAPLVPEAARWIAHAAIRARGTIGGSLAHGDPSAEWPAVAVALDARIRLVGSGGGREVSASEFFLGPLTVDVEPDELITEVRLPAAPPGTGAAVRELAYRDGDYAVVGVAAQVTLGDDGRLAGVRAALFGVDATPLRVPAAEEALLAAAGSDPLAGLADAARIVTETVNPTTDATASEEYRREMSGVFFTRAVRAAERAARATLATSAR